jgi:hypothetical protein
MKKLIGLLLVVFVLTACGATILKSRTVDIDFNHNNYSIYVQAVDSPVSCDITLYVNDTEVAKGTITSARTTTVISGKYKGIKFDAECSAGRSSGLNMKQKCLIYVKTKQVAELTY